MLSLLKTSRLFLLFFFLPLLSFSQVRSRYASRRIPHSYNHHHYYNYAGRNSFSGGELEQDDWIVSGIVSQSKFNSPDAKNAYGISAEYLFADNWSIRGSISINTNYCHITPAPLGILFLKAEENNPGYSRGEGKAFLYSIISLAMNDGLGYNIPIGNRMHLMPYFGTWQVELMFQGTDVPPKQNNLCSMGINFKYQFAGNWLLSTDAEYNRSVLFTDSKWGYHLNFSLGYKIR